VRIIRDNYLLDAHEPCLNNAGQTGALDIWVQPPIAGTLRIFYSIGGSAQNGVDYTNISNSVLVPGGVGRVQAFIEPYSDNEFELDESVTLTLVGTNRYVVDPDSPSATLWIKDCTTNLSTVVATNVPSPVGIDYQPTSRCLLLSVNYDGGGEPRNFALLDTNHNLTYWSGLHGVAAGKEVKIATVKSTANGFTNGDLYFDNGSSGGVGWVSANGTVTEINWGGNSALTNEPDLLGGSLYVDQTGIWNNDLLAVTGDEAPLNEGTRGVWRIHSRTNATQLVRIDSRHLEGILTVPEETRYGPWAGKLLTGDEFLHVIYAVDTNGVITPYYLGIDPDTLLLIPEDEDLYCVDFRSAHSLVLKLDRRILADHIGDILVVQAGEEPSPTPGPVIFIIRWTEGGFRTWSIPLNDHFPAPDFFEKAAFAPLSLPTIN